MLSQFVFVLKIKIKCGVSDMAGTGPFVSYEAKYLDHVPGSSPRWVIPDPLPDHLSVWARLYLKPALLQALTHRHLVCELHP
jgi:hypothetical protein